MSSHQCLANLRRLERFTSHFRCQRYYSNNRPLAIDARPLSIQKLGDNKEGILVLGMNRSRVKNAINFNMLHQFLDIFSSLQFEKSVRALILKSDVPGVFCAGADLKERRTLTDDKYREWSQTIRHMTTQLAELPIPSIAALDGHALGGGLELSLACDIRVSADTSELGLPETGLGIIPGAGGTQRLPRLVGPSVAKDMIITGRRMNGTEASRVGLVNYVVNQNEKGDAAYAKALTVARDITQKGPLGVKMAKIAIDRACEVDINSGLAIEKGCYLQVLVSRDRMEGLAAFAEKRPPKFRGE